MPAAFTKHRPRYQQRPRRPSAAARGYGTDWKALRELAKKELPYVCADCGETKRSMHLDHRTPRAQGGGDDLSNLTWRCWGCHSKKTAERDGGFGNPVKP